VEYLKNSLKGKDHKIQFKKPAEIEIKKPFLADHKRTKTECSTRSGVTKKVKNKLEFSFAQQFFGLNNQINGCLRM
jgi:hypothetical protein